MQVDKAVLTCPSMFLFASCGNLHLIQLCPRMQVDMAVPTCLSNALVCPIKIRVGYSVSFICTWMSRVVCVYQCSRLCYRLYLLMRFCLHMQVDVAVITQTVIVEHDGTQTSAAALCAALNAVRLDASLTPPREQPKTKKAWLPPWYLIASAVLTLISLIYYLDGPTGARSPSIVRRACYDYLRDFLGSMLLRIVWYPPFSPSYTTLRD